MKIIPVMHLISDLSLPGINFLNNTFTTSAWGS